MGAGLLLRADALPAPFCGAVDVIPSWAFSLPWQEKVIDFNGFSTWIRVVGKGSEGGGLFSFLNKGAANKYVKSRYQHMDFLLLDWTSCKKCLSYMSVLTSV